MLHEFVDTFLIQSYQTGQVPSDCKQENLVLIYNKASVDARPKVNLAEESP